MEIPLPPALLTALAEFVRSRLVTVSDTVSLVVVSAAGPFAPNSYSRARLVRQMHASGVLSGDRVARVGTSAQSGTSAQFETSGQSGRCTTESDAPSIARHVPGGPC